MKKIHFQTVLLAFTTIVRTAQAQNVGINTDGSAPNPNAMLDVKSASKGILIPRVSSSARLAIPNTKGLLVYDTTVSAFFFNTGTVWQSLKIAGQDSSGNAPGWQLHGNGGTDSSSFLGTTDNNPLVIKVNNAPSGMIDPNYGNAFYGFMAGQSVQLGHAFFNTSVGDFSLSHNTIGSGNAAVGSLSMDNNTTGNDNTAFGHSSLFSNTTGYDNTAIGYNALPANTTGYYNTAIGKNALATAASSYNTAVGYGSQLVTNSGANNTSMGYLSMEHNTGGYNNTGIGYAALDQNTTGNQNTALGMYTGGLNTTGAYNVAIGFETSYPNQTGNNNTAVGSFAGTPDNLTNLSNITVVGYSALATRSNEVVLGNGAVTLFECAAPLSVVSDGRYKTDIKEDVKGLDFILHLRPVTYRFDARKFNEHVRARQGGDAGPNTKLKISASSAELQKAEEASLNEASAQVRTGFIAQEVEHAANASGFQFSGIRKPANDQDHYSLSYESFVVPLVKAVQEQQALIQEQNQKIAGFQRQLDELKLQLSKQK